MQLTIQWNQRWREGRDSYRPTGETINTREHAVERLPNVGPGQPDAAKDFVERHHYSGSFPAARERFGLFRRSELVGVAVFSVPELDADRPVVEEARELLEILES